MSENRAPSQKLDQYMLRLPDGMRDRIKKLASERGRTMNAEVVQALRHWLERADYDEYLRDQYRDADPEVPGPGDIIEGETIIECKPGHISTQEDIDRLVNESSRQLREALAAVLGLPARSMTPPPPEDD